ncbi:MAG: hypothetical protein EXS16_21830 [Gemmataceae bacterium]|nr:hypothetical protein [Gemmataceae bacterium]
MNFPQIFTDAAGREWNVQFGFPVESRMEQIVGITLDDLIPEIDPKEKLKAQDKRLMPLQKLMTDGKKLFAMFYALVKPQADKLGLTKEQVEEGFSTEASISAMVDAIVGSVQNFTPVRWNSLRKWLLPMVMKMAGKVMAFQDSELEKMRANIDKLSEEDFGKALAAGIASGDESPTVPSNLALQDVSIPSASASPAVSA